MKRRSFLKSLAGTVISLPMLTPLACDNKKKTNIVFILIDDMGWKDVEFMGAKFYETPNIDRLAKEGMIFTNAYAGAPNCAPTRACLMTGMYTPRHKTYTPGGASKGNPRYMKLRTPVREHFIEGISNPEYFQDVFESRDEMLKQEFTSVAEVLGQAGYRTARFGKWHLGPDVQGFDISSNNGAENLTNNFYNDPTVTEKLTDRSIEFITEHQNQPFFLYLSHWDVHTPLTAKQKLVDKYKMKQQKGGNAYQHYNPVYAAMVEAVDISVGRIIRTIKELKLEENTLVIFSSDNGGVAYISDNTPLRAGKGSLYEGGIRVPTCMKWPQVIQPGSTCNTPITSVDFLPTFAELGHAPLPTDQPVDGKSFVPLLKGEPALENRSIFWHFPLYLQGNGKQNFIPLPGGTVGEGMGWRTTPASAIRKGDWKLIEFFEDSRIELYNLKEDVSETKNLASENKEKASELRKELNMWQKTANAPIPRESNPYYDL